MQYKQQKQHILRIKLLPARYKYRQKMRTFCGAIQYRFTVYINKTMTHAGHVCEHIHVNTVQHV